MAAERSGSGLREDPAYYTPFDPKDVNDKKHAWVERIGDECRANDIPYFLEFVGYDEGADEKGLDLRKRNLRSSLRACGNSAKTAMGSMC